MNQVTNLVQWKNITKEDQAGFDFIEYRYEYQLVSSNEWSIVTAGGCGQTVYHLKIQPDKWYYCEVKTMPNGRFENTIKLGEHLTAPFIEACHIVRPATSSEVPEPERVFKDGAFYPVKWGFVNDQYVAHYIKGDGFWMGDLRQEDELEWIGEELKIEWGKS
jgi:hypothetical protein